MATKQKEQSATKQKSLAQVVAETDVMPRATDKQVREAKKKAESAARVTKMVTDQTKPKRAGRRTTDPAIQDEGAILAKSPRFLTALDKDRATRQEAMGVVPDPAPVYEAHMTPEMEQTADVALAGYQGPMLALRSRLKQGLYQKAANGQPSCGDELATYLGELKPAEVIRACLIALDLPTNPYLHLNIGQQSMNLRNKLRGALKKNDFGMGVVIEAIEEVMGERAPTQSTEGGRE